MHVSAEDASGQSIDSDEREVLVPDFTTVGPKVTTPEIYRARTARELTQIREASTVLPTASHQFTRGDQLLLRFRGYGAGGSTPVVAVRLRNSQGETISTLPPPRPRSGGQLEVVFLPANLAPSTYVIEIEASSGDDHARTLWGFAIKER